MTKLKAKLIWFILAARWNRMMIYQHTRGCYAGRDAHEAKALSLQCHFTADRLSDEIISLA